MPKNLESSINPQHYVSVDGGSQVWEMMLDIYGEEDFLAFCRLNAFKYRMRAGKKGDNIEEDIKKALWYENKMHEIRGQ